MQGSSSHEEMKQNQDRRVKPIMQGEVQPQPHPPQKCPRCESLNTKFCYYNNYNLSQPRYFCKTCRRYWTLGGTLRNVPVGGGCRKGKRAKISTSSPSSCENSRSQSQPQHNLSPLQSIISNANSGSTASPALRDGELSGNLVSSAVIPSYYPGGGFVASVAAIPPINNQTLQGFSYHPSYHQTMNLGADLSGSSNLGLLHAFTSIPSFGSQQNQQVQQQRQQLYRVGDSENKSLEHPFQPHERSLVQPDKSVGSSSNQQNWHQQGFIANSNPNISDTALWSICTNTIQGSGDSNDPPSGSTCLNPDHQWRGLPGYEPPP